VSPIQDLISNNYEKKFKFRNFIQIECKNKFEIFIEKKMKEGTIVNKNLLESYFRILINTLKRKNRPKIWKNQIWLFRFPLEISMKTP
jgi:hypothetical protein